MKKDKFKDSIIQQLKEMPIIQLSCKKAGISRASYYRWRAESQKFAEEADVAIAEGEAIITDMSEHQLISLIRDRNFQALQLWLRSHHPKYNNKVEVTAYLKKPKEKLSSEQKAIIKKALRLASLSETPKLNKN